MKNRIMGLCIAIALLAVTGCATTAVQETPRAPAMQTAADTGSLARNAVIALHGTTAAVDGTGASVDGSTITISQGGGYVLSGTWNGQIIVDAGHKESVELVFSGVTVTSSAGAAIYVKKAGSAVITLTEGTQNTLTADASDTEDGADERNAALYSKADLTLRGSGALAAYGNAQNGIVSKSNLVIEGGAITVQAENNGLRGKNSVAVLGGTLTVTAGNDGIQSDNAEGGGTVLLTGGTLAVTCGHDAVQAETLLRVTGGAVTLRSGGGYAAGSYSRQESYKALKSAGDIEITGGTVTANSLDDTIHAGGSVAISGGALTLLSGDDGIHADGTVAITGGVIDIQTCYEGIEGTVIHISGGSVSLLAQDDGLNAAGGAQNDRMGPSGDTGSASLQVYITGGVITVNAYGDGVDSNGNVTMTGGALYISGPISSQSGALDYDRSFTISGGTLVAAGSAGMAQTPDSSSSQPSIIVYFNGPQAAGNTYFLTDESGSALVRYAPDKAFQCIVFSTPALAAGGTYSVAESADGTLENAVRLYNFTLSDTVTSVYGQDP